MWALQSQAGVLSRSPAGALALVGRACEASYGIRPVPWGAHVWLAGRAGCRRLLLSQCLCCSYGCPFSFTSYQRAFDEFLERCRQLRNYRANVIANINNCLSFR